jgi:hypothetical protein
MVKFGVEFKYLRKNKSVKKETICFTVEINGPLEIKVGNGSVRYCRRINSESLLELKIKISSKCQLNIVVSNFYVSYDCFDSIKYRINVISRLVNYVKALPTNPRRIGTESVNMK